jgi:hypothetical protein
MGSKVLKTEVVLNAGEASALKARIYDLSESGAKQAMYGMVRVLAMRGSIRRDFFEECVDDAAKFTQLKKGA